MRNSILLLVLLLALASGYAAPTCTLQSSIDVFALKFSTTDALHGRAFVVETPGVYVCWKRGATTATTSLTAALDENSPVFDTFIFGAPEISLRWELGSPMRQLNTIHVWWSLRDPARNAINVKFAARDAATQAWRDIMTYQKVAAVAAVDNTFALLTITFPAGEVTNIDALRLIDGSGLASVNNTRFVAVDAVGGAM
ncbi:MAG TPA: hypothetical protein VGL77_00080 [Armatimonadota bacterium]